MSYRRFGLLANHRRSMFRNLVTSLLLHDKIETTETRAMEIKKIADRMITLGKRGDLHAKRQADSYLMNEDAVFKLFGDVAKKYEDRPGGYTRVIKTGFRKGDGAPMAILELVD